MRGIKSEIIELAEKVEKVWGMGNVRPATIWDLKTKRPPKPAPTMPITKMVKQAVKYLEMGVPVAIEIGEMIGPNGEKVPAVYGVARTLADLRDLLMLAVEP